MSLLFLVFIHNAALIASGLNINIANKQRYLIVRIQAAPEELCKRIDVIRDKTAIYANVFLSFIQELKSVLALKK